MYKKACGFLIGILLFFSLSAKSASQFAVASANAEATKAGMQVLKRGGNAFDAAITVASVLAVAEPYNSGLGGGGFWLFYDVKQKKYHFLDAREIAPQAAKQKMYADDLAQAINGPLSAGIPGEVAGMLYLSQHYAKHSLAEDLQPAIDLANDGFKVTARYRQRANFRLLTLLENSGKLSPFLFQKKVPPLGSVIKQPQLAKTLREIVQTNGQSFYQGEIAQKMVSAVQRAGGIWTLADLQHYKVILRTPLMIQYKDKLLITAPLPSAGGIALATMLNLIVQTDYYSLSPVMKVHYLTEFMRNIYFDRYRYLGDPNFAQVPVSTLISKAHATQIMQRIYPNKATPSSSLPSITLQPSKSGMHTTHYSIIDAQGNIVSATLSLNYPFGSGFVAGDTGVLLNDEMGDFALGDKKQNAYGLLGGKNNLIEPGKRPLSSMTPTIIQSKNKIIVLGTPGGSKIVTMMMLAVIAALEGYDAKEIVALPRYHMQFFPDLLQYEANAFNQDVLSQLSDMGYHLKLLKENYGNMQVVIYDKKQKQLTAASDPRGEGLSLVQE